MRSKFWISIVVALACVTAACGGDDDDQAGDDTTEATDTGTATEEPTADDTADDTATDTADDTADDTATDTADDTADGGDAVDPDGVVRISWITPPRSLDPHLECHIGCRPYWLPVFETLYDIDEKAAIVPLAAAELPTYSDDGLTLTIPLRPGRTFHDGTPIDAAAVKASMERAMTLEASTAAPVLALVTAIDVIDENTVQLTLSQGSPGFESGLVGGPGALISPAALEAGVDLNADPGDAGSGPYLVDSFIPDDKVVYTPAGDYDLVPERGRAGTLQINGVPEVLTGINALQAGEFELAFGSALDGATRETLTANGFDVLQKETLNVQAILLRITEPPLDNPLVRQAMNYALDRQLISDTVYEGTCAPTSQAFSPLLPAAVPDYDPYAFDQDKARELLAEAGFADGFDLEIVTVAGNFTSEQNALVAQQMLGDIGINVILTPMSSPDGVAAFGRDEIMARSTVLSFRSDALGTMQNLFLAGGQNHMAVPEDGPLVELLDELGTAPASERDAILQEMGKYITDSVFALPICLQSSFWAAVPEVVGDEDMLYTTYGVFDPRALAIAAE